MICSSMDAPRLLICQNTACRKAGAVEVLAAFRAICPEPGQVVSCGCLGQCGNGPMVLVLPEKIWYHQVHPDQVQAIVQRHLGNVCCSASQSSQNSP